MIDDIKAVTERVRTEHPDLPLILLGHSMGSMAVRSFVKRYDDMISGLIVCGSPSRNSGAGIGKLVARLYAARAGEKCRPKIIQSLAFGSFNRRFRHRRRPSVQLPVHGPRLPQPLHHHAGRLQHLRMEATQPLHASTLHLRRRRSLPAEPQEIPSGRQHHAAGRIHGRAVPPLPLHAPRDTQRKRQGGRKTRHLPNFARI